MGGNGVSSHVLARLAAVNKAAHHSGCVVQLEAGVARRESRVGIAVSLALVIGGDGQRSGVDRQRTVYEGDGIVARRRF